MEVNFCFLTTFLKEELKWGIGETRPSLEVVGWIRSKQQGTQSCSINIQYYTTSTYDMVVRHFFSLFLQKWNMRAAGWLELRGKIIGLCILCYAKIEKKFRFSWNVNCVVVSLLLQDNRFSFQEKIQILCSNVKWGYFKSVNMMWVDWKEGEGAAVELERSY